MTIKKLFEYNTSSNSMKRGVQTRVTFDKRGRVWLVNGHTGGRVELKPGDTATVGLYLIPQTGFFRHYGVVYNSEKALEVTSEPRETPPDTPSLDTSFHDREMDV